jgi:Flp pilus assembly protein TadG
MVELALALPILLLLVTGIVDIGRIYSFSIAVTNAAREAAVAAARDPQAGADAICQRARDELAPGPASVAPCTTAPITVQCVRGGSPCGIASNVIAQSSAGADVAVTVTYQVPLVTGYLVGRVFPLNPVAIGATATFSGLSE